MDTEILEFYNAQYFSCIIEIKIHKSGYATSCTEIWAPAALDTTVRRLVSLA